MPQNNKIDELLDDHSRTPVPDSETLSGIHIALIVFGVFITLPVFWIGADVTQQIGTRNMLWVAGGVSLFLGVLSYLTALVGNRSRLSTYMVMHFSFGRHGAKLVNVIMAITMLGFFSATLEIFGTGVADALKTLLEVETSATPHILWGSLVMTLTAVFGFRAMDKLSLVSVPLMALFMCYVIKLTLDQAGEGQLMEYQGTNPDGIPLAISGVIGMAIMTAGLMPDFARFARNDRASLIAALGLMLGYPFVMISGGLPSILLGDTEIMPLMAALGIVLPALLILVFSTWTTNTANLYANTLTVATILPIKDWKLTVAGGVIATLSALLGFMQYFFDMLLTLSIVVPPLAAIYLSDFFLVRKQHYDVAELDNQPAIGWAAIISWLVASAVAWVTTYNGITLTSQPAIDSMLIAAISYLTLNRLKPQPATANA